MKKLILVALVIISSLNPSQALAQLSLACNTQGSLVLNTNQTTFSTTQPAQCSFAVDNATSPINVDITLSEPTLDMQTTTGKADPYGTTRTAELTYTNSGSKIVHENSSITDTFSSPSTTNMAIVIQIQRPHKFFAGYYSYKLMINITAN